MTNPSAAGAVQVASTAAPPPIKYEPLKEVRFAVVIYGGVSLAIYINGIVQEMLALVRATAPASTKPGDDQPLLSSDQLDHSSEAVYRKLGQLLGEANAESQLESRWAAINNDVPLPIRTRFVVDVLSGTSAGGINGIFLAKALTNNVPLKPLQRLWETKGDIEVLINDARSLTNRVTRQRPPQSLLNSRRMYQELLDALDGMDRARSSRPSPLVDKLELFSTTTDIYGLALPITLADGVVKERRHRNVFHFQHVSKGPGACSDFQTDDNPFLAYAARCTSAFPFAFEPMALCDIFPILQTSELHEGKDYCDPDTAHWQKHYLDYLDNGPGSRRSEPFQLRPFGDGGYLDNKPFTYAIDTMLKRHADLPVERKLIYIEPSPESVRAEAPAGSRPDAIENSLAALLTLPRYETIRQDLELVVDRNIQIERINRVLESVSQLLQAPNSGELPDEWLNKPLETWGAGYATYEQLKLTTVTDDLAALLASAFRVDTRSALGTAVRIIASNWRLLQFPSPQDGRRFLLEFDIEFRLRRIRHVLRHINKVYAQPTVQEAIKDEFRGELRRIKDKLGEPYLTLQHLVEKPPLAPELLKEPVLTEKQMTLVVEPPSEPSEWPGLKNYPHALERSPAGARDRAKYVLQDCGSKDKIATLAKELSKNFEQVTRPASAEAEAAFADSPSLSQGASKARETVRTAYKDFERHDSAAFPIIFGTNVGDCERIDIHRISPKDAVAREQDVLQGRQKLRGQGFGAFGAFFDERWRRNDILWGRLDGSERLITMLLPGNDAAVARVRSSLIDEAHEAIIKEFLPPTADKPQHPDWRVVLRTFVESVRDEPEPKVVASSAARATAVTGELLDGIVDARRWAGKAFLARVTLFARFFWQFLEVSVPRTWRELFGTYLVQLVLLFSTVLLVAAVFNLTNWRFATLVFGAAVTLFGGRQLLRRYLRGDLIISPVMTMLLTVLVVVLLAIGVDRFPAAAPSFSEMAQRGWAEAQDLWRAAGTSQPTFARWARSLLIASVIITAISGIVLARVSSRSQRGKRTGKRIGLQLQLARVWSDVIAAVGQYDLEARAAAAQATRADFGFAAGYGLLFLATGLLLTLNNVSAGFLIAVSGVAAAVCDGFENQAVLTVLTQTPPDNLTEPLNPAPFPFAVAKWILVAVALMTTLLSTLLSQFA